jgi:pimeloyl-ACP methyl ester carboxylesterase
MNIVTAERTQAKAPRYFSVPEGGRLAYEEYGVPDGRPVFFFHGWPASRLQGRGCAMAAAELGVRIISPDRPGIGRSTFQGRRRLLDWPPMVEALADHLGIKDFRVVGVSGGGPYAFVTGWALPDRVKAIAIVSGAPPLAAEVGRAELFAVYRWLLSLHRRRPGLARAFFQAVRPVATICPPRWLRPWLLRAVSPADADALRDPAIFDRHFEVYREAWHDSAGGVVTDAEIYAQDWGFPLEEMRIPVQLWHGQDDRNFSWKLARELAQRLPHCTAHFMENEGHYSLLLRHWPQILRTLVES